MAKMQNAPVEYVIGVVRFPVVLDIERFAGDVQKLVNDEYPFALNLTLPNVTFRIENGGVQVTQEDVSVYQFQSEDRDWAVFINKGLIGLHTCAYTTHEDFIDRLLRVVHLVSAMDGRHLRYVDAIALRYLDLIVPLDGESLDQYINPSVAHTTVDLPGFQPTDSIQSFGLESGEHKMRVQVARNPQSVVPPDLASPLIEKNEWHIYRPMSDFATIDVDHTRIYQRGSQLENTDIKADFFSLRQPLRDIFDRIATPHAVKIWSGE